MPKVMSKVAYGTLQAGRAAAVADYATRHRKVEFVMVCLFGIAVGAGMVGRMYGNDFQAGYRAGVEAQEIKQAAHEAQVSRDLQEKGLCHYADLACGYYHHVPTRSERRKIMASN